MAFSCHTLLGLIISYIKKSIKAEIDFKLDRLIIGNNLYQKFTLKKASSNVYRGILHVHKQAPEKSTTNVNTHLLW